MKINEVEQLVGVTKRNIRFYEKGGASLPRPDGQRLLDYGEEDVEALRKISCCGSWTSPGGDSEDAAGHPDPH